MEDKFDTVENQTECEPIVPDKSVKMRVWNIACYILFAAGIAFFVFYIIGSQHIPFLNYTGLIVLSMIAALMTIFFSYITSLTKIGAARFVALIIAGLVLAGNWFIYFRYLPKYGPSDACTIVQADPEYSSANIVPHIFILSGDEKTPFLTQLGYYGIKDNPFCEMGYILDVVYDQKVTASISFDSVTGKYESREPAETVIH